ITNLSALDRDNPQISQIEDDSARRVKPARRWSHPERLGAAPSPESEIERWISPAPFPGIEWTAIPEAPSEHISLPGRNPGRCTPEGCSAASCGRLSRSMLHLRWCVPERWWLILRVPDSRDSSGIHRQDDLSDLRIAQHVSVCIADPLKWKDPVNDWFQLAAVDCLQQIAGESFAASERFLCRPGTKGDP